MCCIVLSALAAATATTQLTAGFNYEGRTPWLPQNAERKPVCVNWVVVVDENGKRQLRMRWNVTAGDD